jgi:hypothetical protein
MNYLSHYYFDQLNPDPYKVLGVALPDLVKNHNRRWNIRPEKYAHRWESNEKLRGIYEGWARHMQVDQLFHDSDFFKRESGIITSHIRSLPLETKGIKPFMVGHIGLELMLDTLLIQSERIKPIDFYKTLNACELPHIEGFLVGNEIEEAQSFFGFYERFCSVQYLLNYENQDSIVYALNRIQYRLSGSYFSEHDNLALKNAFSYLLPNLEERYLSIFEEIELKLNEI